MRIIAVAIISSALAALLGGCDKTNSESHILHSRDITSTSVITDAKQRIVWNRKVNGNQTILCAEPSPDVAQAFSEGMKLAASLSASSEAAGGTSQSVDASGSFARSYAGAVAELGQRLAVIQLLRDEMYRACEAYANGALTKVSYTLKLARLDKKMATLLSSEIAAGALRRPSAVLGSSAGVDGVDDEALKAAEKVALDEIGQLEATGKEPDAADKQAALEERRKAAEGAVRKLAGLQLQPVSVLARANGQGVGQREAMSAGETQQSLVDIHQNFLDDSGVEPLMDACITAMNELPARAIALPPSSLIEEYRNTADFLRSALDEPVSDIDQDFIRQALVPQATFDAEGKPAPATRGELTSLLKETEVKLKEIFGGLAKAPGAVFGLQCMDTFMGKELKEDGFIARVIAAKERLRDINVSLKKEEVRLLTLQTCREAAVLLDGDDEKRAALEACVEATDEENQ